MCQPWQLLLLVQSNHATIILSAACQGRSRKSTAAMRPNNDGIRVIKKRSAADAK
jgi:hypothetical protein